MKHRAGVTLVEVLVTIFIMGIGMLALLVLFPLGALNMAQALKDDRCGHAAATAESIAVAQDIRIAAGGTGATAVTTLYNNPGTGGANLANLGTNVVWAGP